MSNYPDTTLTNAGHDILSEAIAKGKALIFTKVKIGDGLLEADQSVATLTTMISSKMEVPLSSGETTKGQAKLRFAVDNSTLEDGFWAREVGIFAKVGEDGEETLYAYTNGGNYVDFIPDKSRPIDAQIMDVYIITANATDVKIQVDSTAFLNIEDLKDHDESASAHSASIGALIRQPVRQYYEGDTVYISSTGSKFFYECIQGGFTSNDTIDTSGVDNNVTLVDGEVIWKAHKIGSGGGHFIGEIVPFAGNGTIPTGFLLCDGSLVSRTTYPDLFACIGTTYGEGDGETTFALPDLRDKFIEGSETAGTNIEAGLPNITGWIGNCEEQASPQDVGLPLGAFSPMTTSGGGAAADSKGGLNWGFDASRSNAIYGSSDTVQPPAVTVRYIIKAGEGAIATDGSPIDISKYALKTYVDVKIADLVNGAPEQLTTLQALSKALNNDEDFGVTVMNAIAKKLDATGGTITGDLTVNGTLNASVSRAELADRALTADTATKATTDSEGNKLTSYIKAAEENEDGSFSLIKGDGTKVTIQASTSGGSSGYRQVTHKNITAPKTVSLIINNTPSLCLPPVECLKSATQETNVDVKASEYVTSDESNFTHDSGVEFTDSGVKLKTSYSVAMTIPVALGDSGYISESDYIDLGEYKSVEGVNV